MNAPRSGYPINLTLEALGDRWNLLSLLSMPRPSRPHERHSTSAQFLTDPLAI
jgi:hypothetical protein